MNGGKLFEERDFETSDWLELAKIKYRTKLEATKGKMQIMSKEEMLKEGVQSPDTADALSFTFRTPDTPYWEEEELEMMNEKETMDEGNNRPMDRWNPFSGFPMA